MDGYAVRAADAAKAGARLRVIGSAPAGHPFAGEVGTGQAVRLFTGSVVPKGADTIVIQEDASAEGEHVALSVAASSGRHIRPAGLDFHAGDTLVQKGRDSPHATLRCSRQLTSPASPSAGNPASASPRRGRAFAPRRATQARRIVASSGYGYPRWSRSGRRGARSGYPLRTASKPSPGIAEAAKGCDMDRDARRRLCRRLRPGAARARTSRFRARFLENRHEAWKAAHLRAPRQDAATGFAPAIPFPRSCVPICFSGPPSPPCSESPCATTPCRATP